MILVTSLWIQPKCDTIYLTEKSSSGRLITENVSLKYQYKNLWNYIYDFPSPFRQIFLFLIFRVFLNNFRHFRVVLISAILLCYKKFKHRASNLYERNNFLCFSRFLCYIWRSQRLKRVNFQHLVDVF